MVQNIEIEPVAMPGFASRKSLFMLTKVILAMSCFVTFCWVQHYRTRLSTLISVKNLINLKLIFY